MLYHPVNRLSIKVGIMAEVESLQHFDKRTISKWSVCSHVEVRKKMANSDWAVVGHTVFCVIEFGEFFEEKFDDLGWKFVL